MTLNLHVDTWQGSMQHNQGQVPSKGHVSKVTGGKTQLRVVGMTSSEGFLDEIV